MRKAYRDDQRTRVQALLEEGRDEDEIERETGVVDRTIRRWKLELERTGRIGKPPESRTGRHRALSPEKEEQLVQYSKDNPNASVDDILWWLYDTDRIVVANRTVRRILERQGDKPNAARRSSRKSTATAAVDPQDEVTLGDGTSPSRAMGQYHSPYAPTEAQDQSPAEQHLVQALQQDSAPPPPSFSPTAAAPPEDDPIGEDNPEMIQIELELNALHKREQELKMRMRKITHAKTPPAKARLSAGPTPQSASTPLYNPPSSLYDPRPSTGPSPPKRDSRSKKKIAESKRRTKERHERMLRDLERRSRRRDHLTAEWVQSKDIWPLRAQSTLADLMHRYGYYTFSHPTSDTFEAMYRDLYELVDLSQGDWIPPVHDEMLRERMKRKMTQLRTKMQKTGEIRPRQDGYSGFVKADDYTGTQAGAEVGDDSELPADLTGAPPPLDGPDMHYDPTVPDHHHHQQIHANDLPYAHPLMAAHPSAPYPMMDHHAGMLPYGQMNGQQGGMVM